MMQDSLSKIPQGVYDIFLWVSSACATGIVVVLGVIWKQERSINTLKKDVEDIKDMPIMTTPVCDARYLAHKEKLEEIHKDLRMLTSKLIPDATEKQGAV